MAVAAAQTGLSGASSYMSTTQGNNSIGYQQGALYQDMVAAQNKAAAEMMTRRKEANRTQARTNAQIAATGIDATSGSFLDLIGQGAAAGEMDVLKAKYDGDASAWSLNNKINELETHKKNAFMEAGLAMAKTGLENADGFSKGFGDLKSKFPMSSGSSSISTVGKESAGTVTSGGGGFGAAMEGTVA